MGKTALFCLLLCGCFFLLLIPPCAAEGQDISDSTLLRKLRQEKHHAVFNADEAIAEGDRAKQGGDYVEALGNYNMAIDRIQDSKLSQPEKNKKLAEIYRHKAELYRVRQEYGDDTLAAQADQKAESYIAAGTYSGPSSCFTLLVYNGTPLESTVSAVQDFRDNAVRKTWTGSRFMHGFNAWYYSFSPSASSFITRHPSARALLALYMAPLLGIVMIARGIFFSLSGLSPELAVTCTLVAGGALYGILYLFPLSALAAIAARSRGLALPVARMVRMMAAIWLCCLAMLVTGAVLTLDPVAVVGSVSLVLSSVILATTAGTCVFCRLIRNHGAHSSPVRYVSRTDWMSSD